MILHRHRTKRVYYQVLELYLHGMKRADISRQLGVPYSTVNTWCEYDITPRCISEKWEKRKKTTYLNLGEHTKRNDIYLNHLNLEEIAYFLGVYLSDGNSYAGFDMQVKNKNFADYTAQLLTQIMGRNVYSTPYKRIKYQTGLIEEGFRVRVHNKNLKEWLERITDNKRRVPIFQSKKEILWFISAFIDGGGCIKKNGNGRLYTNMRIELSQKGMELLTQIKGLLSTLNIKSSIKIDRKDYFKMYIYSKLNFELLIKEGNLQIPYKKSKLMYAITNGNKGFIRGVKK